MCGIAGVRRFDGGAPDPGLLAAMTDTLRHRGPDGSGHAVIGSVGLGHRRLSIIDVAHSAQPMTSAGGRQHISFNGEILNYRALREGLDYPFGTAGDTETLLALHAVQGISAVRRLEGQFAYAWFDEEADDLWLVRDRLGILPLYYYADHQMLAFASEIKALLPALPDRLAPDEQSVRDFLRLRAVPAPHTMFRGIQKLPPGSVLKISATGPADAEHYWRLPPSEAEEAVPATEAVERLRYALTASVQRNLVADVPVGAYLSGGLDSSLIVALAAQQRPGATIETFAAGFGDPRMDELPHARRVSEMLGTQHHEVDVRPDDFASHWHTLTWHRDAPVSQTSDVAVFRLAQLASQHVKVVLSGEGSDELFGGYPKHRFATMTARAGLVPLVMRRAPLARLAEALSADHARLRIALRSLGSRTEQQRLDSWFASFTEEEILRNSGPTLPRDRHVHSAGGDPLRRMLAWDTTGWLPDNLLERADRMSMAASLEVRPPFLDRAVVELAFALPSNVKVRGGISKWVVKEVARGLVPDPVIDRPKAGFKVPTDEWFRTGLRAFTEERLLDGSSFAASIYSQKAMGELLSAHFSGRRNEELRIWTLLSLEIWYDVFFRAERPAVGIAS